MELSINELEKLVDDGKFKKKELKWSYKKEYLSRLAIFGRVSAVSGLVGVMVGYALNKHAVDPGLHNYFVIGGVFASLPALALGPLFFNWKESAKPYIDAGGKVIYTENKNNLFKKPIKISLPLNYNSNEKDEKIKLSIPSRGHIDSYFFE